MGKLLTIIVVATLVEAIWENLKMIWQSGKVSIDMIGSLIVSIVIAILTKIDVFNALGITINIYAGSFLTGIIISRGANFVHDLLAKVNQLKNGKGESEESK